MSSQKLLEPLKSFMNDLSSCHIPMRVDKALEYPRWVQAMKEEIEALLKNEKWSLVSLPEGKKN